MMKTCQRHFFKAFLLLLPLAYVSSASAHHPVDVVPVPAATHKVASHHSRTLNKRHEVNYQPSSKSSPWGSNNHQHDFIFLVDHGHKDFKDLTPEERQKLRKRRETFHSLPKEEQERIYRAREKFRNMPPEKREKLRKKWKNMSPEERERLRKKKYKHK